MNHILKLTIDLSSSVSSVLKVLQTEFWSLFSPCMHVLCPCMHVLIKYICLKFSLFTNFAFSQERETKCNNFESNWEYTSSNSPTYYCGPTIYMYFWISAHDECWLFCFVIQIAMVRLNLEENLHTNSYFLDSKKYVLFPLLLSEAKECECNQNNRLTTQ